MRSSCCFSCLSLQLCVVFSAFRSLTKRCCDRSGNVLAHYDGDDVAVKVADFGIMSVRQHTALKHRLPIHTSLLAGF